MKRKKISILGATGSIGKSSKHVILNNPDAFDVYLVSANNNAQELANTAKQLNAKHAIIANSDHYERLKSYLSDTDIQAHCGSGKIEEFAAHSVDILIAAIMGFQGLRPIVAALNAGVNVAIANKEPLVAAGPQIIAAANESGAQILPIDSEHNAIYQVFEKNNRNEIDRIILTASGGPFLNKSNQDVYNATLSQAVAHPNWEMGQKISIDSATMMNKALEIIEAHFLFDMSAEQIDVLIHPSSTIHSMVSYRDGSILSQMGASDMCTPIAYALAYPDRIDSYGEKLDLKSGLNLQLLPPDYERFPALTYAFDAIRKGQNSCIALNAANEIAVESFIKGKIAFGQITQIVAYALYELHEDIKGQKTSRIEEVEALDRVVRDMIIDYIETL